MSHEQQPSTPKQWAILELMGHQRIAGQISEYAYGGSSFIRVDIPEIRTDNGILPGFTRLYGPSAVYCVSFVDEPTATYCASQIKAAPLSSWDIRSLLNQKALPSSDLRQEYEAEDIPM